MLESGTVWKELLLDELRIKSVGRGLSDPQIGNCLPAIGIQSQLLAVMLWSGKASRRD